MNQPSIRKNFIFRALYELLVIAAPLITIPYIARVLGSDGAGISSWTGSVMAFFTMFAALGTPQYGLREIARSRDDVPTASKLFWEIELMTVFTSLVCLLAWLGVCIFWKEYRIYFLALTPMLLGTMFDISWFFTAYEKVGYTVLRNAVFKILGIVLLVTLVRSKEDLTLSILLASLTNMFGSLSMWTYLPKMLAKVDFHTLTFRKHFRETLVYFIPTIATSIYTVLDKFLLGLITRDYNMSGYYDHATRLFKIADGMVFTSLNAVMEARVSYLFAQGRTAEIKQRIHRAMDFTMLAGLGCVFGIAGIAKVFVPFFWGPGWEPVETLIYLLCPLTIIIGVSYCLGSLYYNPSGNRAQSAKYLIIGSCVNLVMNLLLIPRWSAYGAVAASVLAEGTITFLYVRNCRGYLTARTIFGCAGKRLPAGAAMCVLVMVLGRLVPGSSAVKLIIQILAGTGFYTAALYLAGDGMLKEVLAQLGKYGRKAVRLLGGRKNNGE